MGSECTKREAKQQENHKTPSRYIDSKKNHRTHAKTEAVQTWGWWLIPSRSCSEAWSRQAALGRLWLSIKVYCELWSKPVVALVATETHVVKIEPFSPSERPS